MNFMLPFHDNENDQHFSRVFDISTSDIHFYFQICKHNNIFEKYFCYTICNMALADLFLGTGVLLSTICVLTEKFYCSSNYSNYICAFAAQTVFKYRMPIIITFSKINICNSVYSFLYSAFVQYINIMHPYKYIHWISRKTMVVGIIIIWLWSILTSTITLEALITAVSEHRIHDMEGAARNTPAANRIFWTSLLCCPIFFIIAMFLRIYIRAKFHLNRISAEGCPGYFNKKNQSNFAVFAALCLIFIICWTPFVVFQILTPLYPGLFKHTVAFSSSILFNALANPLMLLIRSRNFRKHFISYFPGINYSRFLVSRATNAPNDTPL